VQPAAVRRADERAGDRERQPVVPRLGPAAAAAQAAALPEGDVRPHGGVLEAQPRTQAQVQRNTPLPTKKKSRIRANG